MLETRQTEKGQVLSAGYPALEKLIDTEEFGPINKVFETAYNKLMELAKVKRGLKKSREARKAMRSIELVMGLLKELLEIKYRLQEMIKRMQAKKV